MSEMTERLLTQIEAVLQDQVIATRANTAAIERLIAAQPKPVELVVGETILGSFTDPNTAILERIATEVERYGAYLLPAIAQSASASSAVEELCRRVADLKRIADGLICANIEDKSATEEAVPGGASAGEPAGFANRAVDGAAGNGGVTMKNQGEGEKDAPAAGGPNQVVEEIRAVLSDVVEQRPEAIIPLRRGGGDLGVQQSS